MRVCSPRGHSRIFALKGKTTCSGNLFQRIAGTIAFLQDTKKACIAASLDMWCGDRQTVVGREGTVFAGLESSGFFYVPHRVSINKSASYGFQRNRIGGLRTIQ
ncbi:hypothetical protein D3C76_657500 [compost metagenome]